MALLLPLALMAAAAQPCHAQPAALDPLAEQLTHLALALPADAFERSFRQLMGKSRSPERRSAALHQALLALREQPPSSAGRWLVDHLATEPPPLLAPHPERAGVMHDPGGLSAAAQGTRNRWAWDRWRQRLARDGKRGSWLLLDELATTPDPTAPEHRAALRGAAAGIRELPAAALGHPELRVRLLGHPSLAPLTLAVAEITRDETLLLEASLSWPAGDQAAMTLKLASIVGSDKALSVWRRQLAGAGPTAPYARQALRHLLAHGSVPEAQAAELRKLLDQSP